jgi:hypothetical protein
MLSGRLHYGQILRQPFEQIQNSQYVNLGLVLWGTDLNLMVQNFRFYLRRVQPDVLHL